MLFMVIERFKDARAVYRRMREKGRMLPQGLIYVESWVQDDHTRCFQLMKCDNASLLNEWMAKWQDLVDFEIVPVVESKQAAREI